MHSCGNFKLKSDKSPKDNRLITFICTNCDEKKLYLPNNII